MLEALVSPGSVAIIGASDTPTRIGGRPVNYLLRAGFPGPIWPVNPNRDIVQGLRSYPSIHAVPEAPDACIIAVAAGLVPDLVADCADRGTKAAVILSSGFSEADDAGKVAQDRIRDTARRTGMRVLGPNTLGLFNAHTRWIGTFASTIHHGMPDPGPVSIASQSGAVGSELFSLLRQRGLNTGIWITTGNEADVDLADAIAYLAHDPDTEIIVAYAEGVRNGTAMRSALTQAATEGKPVIFMKSGRSAAGAAAVQAHTAALAGSDPVYSALFSQFGVIRVRDSEELVDAVYARVRAPLPAGRRLLILTISGGAGVQMADAAEDLDLLVPPPSADAQDELKALLPFSGVRNPVDTTAQVFNDMSLIGRYLGLLLANGDYDAVTLFLTSVAASEDVALRLIAELDEASQRFPDVPLVVSLAAPADLVRPYEEAGYPVFAEPTRAVRAIAFLSRLSESLRRPITEPPLEIPDGAERIKGGPLDQNDSMRILRSWGIPCAIRRSEADVTGVAAGAMGDEGIETVIGIRKDPTLGPVVMVGLGGVLADVLDDVALRLAPFEVDEAHRMIGELKGARFFRTFRGRPELDVDALATLLSKVSVFGAVEADALESVEMRPVWVLPRGQGVVALDALIVPGSTNGGPP